MCYLILDLLYCYNSLSELKVTSNMQNCTECGVSTDYIYM